MSLPRYSRYKPSGVEWLDAVPEHWRIDRIKGAVASCRNGIWGDEPQLDEYDIPCVRVADFDRTRLSAVLDEPTIRNVKPPERAGRLLQRGDLLMEKSGGGELQPVGCAVLYDDDRQAVCSNFVARVRLRPGMLPRYWRYALGAAYSVRLNTRSIKQTSGIQNLDSSQYFDERIAFPPLGEQIAIAAFLDRETAKIDALVAEQERLITLLKEKQQAVIAQAVTKGLNPDAPMKASGVEWLGYVPAHWRVMRLAHLLQDPPRNGISPDVGQGGMTPTFSIAAVRAGVVDIAGHLKFTSLDPASASSYGVRQGDVFAMRGSGSRDLVGTVGIVVEPPPEGCIYPDILIRLRPHPQIIPEYLVSCLNSAAIRPQVTTAAQTAAGIWKVSGRSLGALRLPVPAVEEQAQLLKWLGAQTLALDGLIQQGERATVLLQERRAALILAAVTGQIDVRTAAERSVA